MDTPVVMQIPDDLRRNEVWCSCGWRHQFDSEQQMDAGGREHCRKCHKPNPDAISIDEIRAIAKGITEKFGGTFVERQE